MSVLWHVLGAEFGMMQKVAGNKQLHAGGDQDHQEHEYCEANKYVRTRGQHAIRDP